jgi:hypothetical protein
MAAQQSGELQIAHDLEQFLQAPQHYVELRYFLQSTCIWVCMTSHSVVYGIAHRELCTCDVSLFSRTRAYSLDWTSIRDEGGQRIAAALAYNSTLQTLK